MTKITKFAARLLFVVAIVISFRCEKITYTFDNTKPAISRAPEVISVDDTSATIVFETNEACHAEIKYGISTDYDSVFIISENIQNEARGMPVFTYYDGNHNLLDASDRMEKTALMHLQLIINVNPNRPPEDFGLESDVQIRNLKTNL